MVENLTLKLATLIRVDVPGDTKPADDVVKKQCGNGSSSHTGHWKAFSPLAEIVGDDEDVSVTTSSRRDRSHDV